MIIGFQKKIAKGVGGRGELYPIFLGCVEFFLTLPSP